MSWLFGKGGGKKKSFKGPDYNGTTPTYETGRNIDSIVNSLLIRLNDPSKVVLGQVQTSVQKIGQKENLLVLSKGLKMLIKLRGNKTHKVLIMDEMKKVIDENDVKMPDDLCEMLIRFCIAEIISEKSISSFWQNSAEKLLISLAKYKPKIAAEQLFKHFDSVKVPHYFVIKSLADYSHRFPKLFFPFIKEVLAKTLPLLTSIKQSNIKWVVSAALGRFAENVVVKLRENSELSIVEYSGSFNTTTRHMINHWLKERERKIRLASCEAVGFMSYLIENEHLLELLPKYFTILPRELKKEASSRGDQFPVAHGLKNVIFVVMRDAPEKIEEYLEKLMMTIHSNVCFNVRNAGYKKREENELALLEAFEYLGQKSFYTQQMINFLSKHYDSKVSAVRVGTLRLLAHIIKKLKTEFMSFKESIVSSINIMQQKNDHAVSLQLCKLVEQMGISGYLNCQGGNSLINIVVKTASITEKEIDIFNKKHEKKKVKPKLTPEIVREEADKVLMKFITPELAKNMDNILYPFILEDFVKFEYSDSFAVLCLCISTIAKRKRKDDDFIIDFEKNVNIPRAHVLLARLFVKLCKPYERNDAGTNILRAMYCLSPNIRDTVVETWSKKLPELKKYLDSHNAENYDKVQWASYVLNLVRETINAIDEDEWNVQFGEALQEQAALYRNDSELKQNCLSIYGLVIRKTKYRDFVFKAIDKIVTTTSHSNPEERIGCARGLGQAATTHTDQVLTKLQTIMKAKEGGGGLFGGGKNKIGSFNADTKATALLAYGYVCMLTPIDIIDSRVEVHVVNNILPVLKVHKSPIIKELGLKALDLVAKAVHPSRLKKFKLRSRDEVLKVILHVIKPIPKKKKGMEFFSKLKIMGLEGIIRMIQLPPCMEGDVKDLVLSEVFSLFKINFDKYESTITDNIHGVISAILNADMSQENLDVILKGLEKYICSSVEMERIKSTECYIFALKEFVNGIRSGKKAVKKVDKKKEKEKEKEKEDEKKKKEKKKKEEGKKEEEGEEEDLDCYGRILAKFIPRMTESCVKVRENAYDCIYLVLRIRYFLKTGKTNLPEYIKIFKTTQKLAKSSETRDIKNLIKVLSKVLTNAVDPSHLQSFVECIIETLEDVELDGARGSCVVLNGIVRARGKELKAVCPDLVKSFLEKMSVLSQHEKIVRGLLYTIRELGQHHIFVVLNTLLEMEVPHVKEVKESFQIISTDKKLNEKMLEYFLDIMNNGQIFEEKKEVSSGKKKDVKYLPTKMSLAIIHSMYEILEVDEFQAVSAKWYTKILPSALLRIGASHDIFQNAPIDHSMKILENFCKLVKDEEVLYEVNKKDVFTLLKNKDTFPEGVITFMNIVCEEHPEHVRKIFDFVQPYNTRIHLGHRLSACCMITVLLNVIRDDKEMIQVAINELLRKTGLQEDKRVKMNALKGLSNIIDHPKDILHYYVTPVSNALINCIEDKDEDIVLETMRSIKKVFAIADDKFVATLLMNLSIRLKPSFEKENANIRESSIALFGTLAKFCKGSMGKLILNNVHSYLPTILVHLKDPEENVRVACKEALVSLVPELGSKKLSAIFEKYDEYEDFDKFCEDFSKTFVADFPDYISDFVMNTSTFFKSKWDEIIEVSVLLIGYLFFYITERQQKHVNLRHTINGFIELLKHKNPVIREKTSKVLGNLYLC